MKDKIDNITFTKEMRECASNIVSSLSKVGLTPTETRDVLRVLALIAEESLKNIDEKGE